MGFFSTIFGLFGFGLWISIGLVAGYFLFIYVQSSDVEMLNFLEDKSASKQQQLHSARVGRNY